MGLQLGEKAISKAVKCAKSTVQYWLNRWKESKGLSDMERSGGAHATTEKVDQRISKLVDSDHTATADDIQDVLKRQNIQISQKMIRRRLKEVGVKFSLPTSKLFLTGNHRCNGRRQAQATHDID